MVACSRSATVKLTVTLNTPAGPVTNSSVTRITYAPEPENGGWSTDICGAGILFDLGPKGQIVAPITNNYPDPRSPAADTVEMVQRYFGNLPVMRGGRGPYTIDQLVSFRGKKELQPPDYPAFIYFPDVNDYNTAVSLTADQLPSIEPQLYVAKATIETTQDKPTSRIDPRPPWLKNIDVWSAPGNNSVKARIAPHTINNFDQSQIERCR